MLPSLLRVQHACGHADCRSLRLVRSLQPHSPGPDFMVKFAAGLCPVLFAGRRHRGGPVGTW